MIINFRTRQLERCCNSFQAAKAKWGEPHARKIFLALDQLKAAFNLSEVYSLPNLECHALTQNRGGEFAITTKQPFRIIFKPNHEPVPMKTDGEIDRVMITDIIILEVEDYHGKRK